MPIAQQTTNQIQNTLSKAYKAIKFDLDSDNSLASRTLSLAINGYLNLEIATFADLVNLREAIYTYQNQLTGQIRLHNAAEALLHNVKAFIHENQIGYTALNSHLAKEANEYIDYAAILNNIKAAVAALSGPNLTKNNLVNAIIHAVGASDNRGLIETLTLDMDTSYVPVNEIQARISLITGNDGPTITERVYQAFWDMSSLDSSMIGLNNLSSVISEYQLNNPEVNVVDAIKAAVNNDNVITKNDIATAILSAIDSDDNSSLLAGLEIYFDGANDSVDNIKSNLNRITGTDGPSIASNIYNTVEWNWSAKLDISTKLSSHITLNHLNNNLEYSEILSNIISYVSQAESSPNEIATALLASVNATDDTYLLNEIELLLDGSYLSDHSEIPSQVLSITGADGPSISASFCNLFGFWFATIGQGAVHLTQDIYNYYNNHEITYENIAVNIKNSVLALPSENLDNNKIAQAIVEAVDSSNDLNLIAALELDFDDAFTNNSELYSPLNIQANFAYLVGTDAPSIANSLYNVSIYYQGWQSTNIGAILLSEAIDAYNGTEISTVSLISAIGSNPIGPQADIYLNQCTLSGNAYTVGSSIFSGFDSDNAGLMLSSMEGLNSLSGQMAALSQCSTWARSGEDLYATTTSAIATSGDATETGCSDLLSPIDAMILCYSVFDMMS